MSLALALALALVFSKEGSAVKLATTHHFEKACTVDLLLLLA
jgi:hypothetical protein